MFKYDVTFSWPYPRKGKKTIPGDEKKWWENSALAVGKELLCSMIVHGGVTE